MRTIKELVRPNIAGLVAYSSARDEYKGDEGIFLDANENPFGMLNRYPDPQQKALKAKVSEVKNVPAGQIFVGNGSDEVIDLCYRIFCRPGIDKALTFAPTYGMYDVAAAINDVELIKLPLDNDFQIQQNLLVPYLTDDTVKLLIICSPNNPTGNVLAGIDAILGKFSGIVLVDEAYIDFADVESLSKKLSHYPNLIVCQTLSKAYGLAAARVGMAFASTEIIGLFNKVKPPYNVSALNQEAALQALEQTSMYNQQKALLVSERERVLAALLADKSIKKAYSSDANFLLVEVADANLFYNALVTEKIITRNRNSVVKNCIRISIGTPEENDRLLAAFRSIIKNYCIKL